MVTLKKHICHTWQAFFPLTNDLLRLLSDIPTITTDQGPIIVKNGTSITLTCAVSAYPESSGFYWRKDGAPLERSLNPAKYTGGNLLQTSLTIPEVVAGEDSGIYSCVAENEAGVSTSAGVKLEIQVGELKSPGASFSSLLGGIHYHVRKGKTG